MNIIGFHDHGDERYNGSFLPESEEEVIFIRELRDRLVEFKANLESAFLVVDEEGLALIISRERWGAKDFSYRSEIIDLTIQGETITVRLHFTSTGVSILRDSAGDSLAPLEFLGRVGAKNNYAAQAQVLFDGGGFQITLALGPWSPWKG